MAQQQTQLAVEQNKARLALDTESNNHNWEMAELTDADKWIRRISFAAFTAPFIIAAFAPGAVHTYFVTAIAVIPDWYKQTYMSITGAVWGISSLKNTIPQVLNTFRKR